MPYVNIPNDLSKIKTKIAALQRDYAALWGPLSDLLSQLAGLVKM